MKLTRREILAGLWGGLVGSATISASLYLGGRNQVMTDTAVNVTRIADDGWLITEAERIEIASADQLVESDILNIRDATDLPGGDYHQFRASGLAECVQTCEEDTQCGAFTYARLTHAVPQKRRMCWLKTTRKDDVITASNVYVSGRRDSW